MARNRSRTSSPPVPVRPARRAIRPLQLWAAIAAVAVLGTGAAVFLAAQPAPGHEWHALPPDLGRIRWVSTTTDPNIDPPLAPDWIRKLHANHIPFPTDLPLTPPGASFGSNASGAVWYLIQNNRPTNDLWHAEKSSVKITDATGKDVPWPGGTGSALVDGERRLQYLYLGVPSSLSGTGARLHLRVARFDGPTSAEVSLPF